MRSPIFVLILGGVLAGGACSAHDGHPGQLAGDAMPDLSGSAAASRGGDPRQTWTSQPVLLEVAGAERGAAAFRPSGIDVDRVSVFAPGGRPEQAQADYPVEAGQVRIRPAAPAMGNYHWVQARQERADTVRVASTAWYFSNPGDAPTAMLNQAKSELEIVPAPLPREHARYRESEKWRFLVRWRGLPLAHQALTLETEHGSRSSVFTDDVGIAVVVFPRDFRPLEAGKGGQGGRRRERAGYVLWTAHVEGDRTYRTAFNQSYAPEPERSRSLAWGAAFGAFGMVLAAPLLRRKESNHV